MQASIACMKQGRVREAACWAHVRRKFHDLFEAHASPIAEEAQCNGSGNCTGSKSKFEAVHRINDCRFGKRGCGLCLIRCINGCRQHL